MAKGENRRMLTDLAVLDRSLKEKKSTRAFRSFFNLSFLFGFFMSMPLLFLFLLTLR